ncbi:glycosyltransferase [Phocaeicola coprocola]|uniref:Glycosyltransferase family 1 protein n=1 Tax=Phocaeicola coprocola TaxID=310298 RepID=A0A412GZ74_9BACT|nr:glycosyltransferase [Phocaeicola coprocola]RGS00243.1 glycosyltransferase family 1 protein [Phocaeicola coprocola]
MKVLIYDTTNAFLTPGGKTTHAIKLQKEIAKLGVNIEFSRWWDISQANCDIIHFLTPDPKVAKLAHERGIKCFLSFIFDFESNKTNFQKKISILKNKIIDKLPGSLSSNAYWKSLKYMDCVQFMHKYDLINASRYFPRELRDKRKIIISHAYDPNEINISDHLDIRDLKLPSKYLISCANISERKQTVLLAKYAKLAQVPIVFMGSKSDADPYFLSFKKEIDNKFVFYPGYVSKEWKDCIMSNSSGYVLLSKGESGCIAVYEAAAYNIPLLLSNLPWAWGYENPQDIHFCDYQNKELAITQLKEFFNQARKKESTPFTIHTWEDQAKQYVKQYQILMSSK